MCGLEYSPLVGVPITERCSLCCGMSVCPAIRKVVDGAARVSTRDNKNLVHVHEQLSVKKYW